MSNIQNNNMTMATMAFDYVKNFLASCDEALANKWENEKSAFNLIFSDKKKIKRNGSAYNFFCKEHRRRLKEENPDITEADLKVEISALWKETKDNEDAMATFKQQAQEDKERYEAEKASSGDENDSGKKKKKRLKDKNRPKKALSAYFIWGMDERKKIKEEYPDMIATDVGVELGRRWAVAKQNQKLMVTYNKKAEDEKIRYQAEMALYNKPSDEELLSQKKKSKSAVPKPKKKKHAVVVNEDSEIDEEDTVVEDTVVEDTVVDDLKPSVEEEEVVLETKKKKSSSSSKKKKNTAFLVFCEDMRPKLKEKKMTAKEITKKLKELWEDLGDDEKDFYEDKANE